MQAFNLDHQPAKLVNITIREELKDERGLPDVYLKFVCRLSAATLAQFHPELRAMLYKDGPQQDLDGGSSDSTLRFPELGKQRVSKKIKGAHFTLHYGVGESNGVNTEPVSEDTQLDKFVLDPQEGGTVLVEFRVWGKFTGPQIGNLALTLGRETEISTQCQEPAQGALLDEKGEPAPKRGRKPKAQAEPAEDPFAGSDLAADAGQGPATEQVEE